MRNSPLSESLLCIRCGACLNACPVFREIGGHGYVGKKGESSTYPGPIGSIVSPGLFGQEEFGQLARASSLCGACKEACPVDIDLPKLLLRVRAGGIALNPERAQKNISSFEALGLKIFSWMGTSSYRFSTAERLLGLFSRIAAPFSGWLKLPAFTGWGANKDIPRPATRPFRARWAQGAVQARSLAASEPVPGQEEDEPVQNMMSQPTNPVSREIIENQDLVTRFAKELEALGGNFVACEKQDLPGLILELLDEHGIDSLLAWEAEHLPAGLLDRLKEGSIKICHEFEPALRAGLTGAAAAIADTGTLVLTQGRGRPSFTSLTPEIHIAVFRADQVHQSLPEILQMPGVQQASSTALITGPSRTADIEMTLTIGVHGPGEVHVFCLNGGY
jgi:L-lactate utilization protein LutB